GDPAGRQQFVPESVGRCFIGLGEIRRLAGADRLDGGGIEPRLDPDRRVRVPFELRAPERAGDQDGEFGEARRQAGAEAAECAERLRAIGELRALQPHAQRPLHLAARAGDDGVVHAPLVGVELVVDDVGHARHGAPRVAWGDLVYDARRAPANGDGMADRYRHSQRGSVMLIVLPLAAAVSAWLGYLQPSAAGRWFGWLLAAFFILVTWVFSSLTVEVGDEAVRWHFRPGLWGYRIARADVDEARIVRGKWWHGFGIRMAPGFRLYNVSGLDAVDLHLKSGEIRRIGTDDPHGLLAALKS